MRKRIPSRVSPSLRRRKQRTMGLMLNKPGEAQDGGRTSRSYRRPRRVSAAARRVIDGRGGDHMSKQVAEVMTPGAATVRSTDSVSDAARAMEAHDVGAIPVVDEGMLVGILTDRDIAVRVVAHDKDPNMVRVSQVASANLLVVHPEQTLDEATELMGARQAPTASRGRRRRPSRGHARAGRRGARRAAEDRRASSSRRSPSRRRRSFTRSPPSGGSGRPRGRPDPPFLSRPARLQCALPAGVPEWPKGAGCKPAGSAFRGSNPLPCIALCGGPRVPRTPPATGAGGWPPGRQGRPPAEGA